MSRVDLFCSASAADRRARAAGWLSARRPDEPLLVVGATLEAAADAIREAAAGLPAGFGWQRFTLGRLAAALAAPLLAELKLAPISGLPLQALCARVIHAMAAEGELGKLAAIADRPGLAGALSRTAAELRLAGIRGEAVSGGAGAAVARIEVELRRSGLADRAEVLRLAARALLDRNRPSPLAGLPVLLLDVQVHNALERELVSALAARGAPILATVPRGDDRSLRCLRAALGVAGETPVVRTPSGPQGSLARVQQHLFSTDAAPHDSMGDAVRVVSAPGEGRECVEIARLILREAEAGVPFDRMAILLRAPAQYRALLEESLGRAGIPAHFARGSLRPDPSGRAFLSLLACAAQGLSASRFAEYLSLGEVPDATDLGTPPPPLPPSERWVPPDDELLARALLPPADAAEGDPLQEAETAPAVDPDAPVRAGSLRAPWRWERLLVDAAVIGGKDGTARWKKRLDGLAEELRIKLAALDADDEALADKLRRELDDLAALRAYALPLLDQIAPLRELSASWAEWLDRLSSLATRALRRPDRVLSLLAELQPLSPVGPVGLAEVRLALERRLTDLTVPPARRRYGRVFVAPVDTARGLAFDVVFVPGLAEKIFPPKLHQDALLGDAERAALSPDLEVEQDRVQAERLALRLAAGAARKRLVLSYPRLDAQQARPRVPSFYALEVARAAEGKLPSFTELMRSAERAAQARIGWPAPAVARDAIDEAEHDLALLADVLRLPDAEARGTARYLLSANPYLARALRARGRRFRRRWFNTDGLVDPDPKALEALQAHSLAARSYSATALQHYASCPYRFLLQAIHRLQPREEPQAIDEIDPLSRGSLMHEVQFELLRGMHADGELPLREAALDSAQARLDRVLNEVAAKWKEKLFPAIERVWDDCVASIRADLRRWLLLMAMDEQWIPWHFELAFGLNERTQRDEESRKDAVAVASGLKLRGSIDLVEKRADGLLRATDYKSGKQRMKRGEIVGGGKALQPVLYALALEKLFPDLRVEGGRLYYCTHTGGFEEVPVALDANARGAAEQIVSTVGDALRTGFFPAAPAEKECEWCDYLSVCGPVAQGLVQRKPKDRLQPLVQLRGLP